MAETYEQLLERDIEVLVIGPGTGGEATALIRRLQPPFLVLADPTLALYSALGLGRVFLGVIQQHGTVLLDTAGEIRYRTTGANPGQAYSEAGLLQAISTLTPTP